MIMINTKPECLIFFKKKLLVSVPVLITLNFQSITIKKNLPLYQPFTMVACKIPVFTRAKGKANYRVAKTAILVAPIIYIYI